MTRPRGAAERFVASLPAVLRPKVVPVYAPLIAIKPLNVAIAFEDEAAIFTSANGVHYGPDGAERVAYCVGAATTDAACSRGWIAERRGRNADDLVASLIADPPLSPLIHVSGVHKRGDIAERLTAHGIPTRSVAVYDQVAQDLTHEARALIQGGKPLILPLFSPRTAHQFASQVPQAGTVRAIALSEAVADALVQGSYGAVSVAATPDATAMCDAIARVLSDLPSG
ncbi:uroporphyrinogen-III synthase [uncultured Tateyamaria sp.]|uniref:uroporphyrinogen-III synthase n=1 Tax=uncultured Tateyamaria sp. TaxID=455651 RepID=UPI00262F5597|nr:uroporphyrinogen-III synthase [uncultured Tateyamaria sp.]